ncbi:MAG: ice-binding family protein [Spirochaetes bacterium]|nr:ice-binding family protein [Spirochaetota bacterium]
MRIHISWFITLLLAFTLITGCESDSKTTTPNDNAPTVTSSNPTEGDEDININGNIIITFSAEMDPLTITDSTFTLKQGSSGSTNISGVVSLSDSGVITAFNPDSNLATNTEYIATVSIEAKDIAGNALAAEFTLSFTTGSTEDTVAPTVVSTTPEEGELDIAINRNIVITFNEAINPLSITDSTFMLKQGSSGSTNISGVVSLSDSGNIVTFEPDSNLTTSTAYKAIITTEVKDIANNELAAEFALNFTTGTTSALGPMPVELGTADTYVILAKTGISKTTTDGTAITGNIGISPAEATYITGFSLDLPAGSSYSTSIYVTEFVYAPGYANPTPSNLTTAISNMESAYTDAAGRLLPDKVDPGSAGEIGGLTTLSPGLYKFTTGVTISTDLTLTGGSDDVWIFQIPGNFTMASGVKITLAGGAVPKNIFWQVAGSTTIETTAVFNGIMLCKTEITMKTQAEADGRLLAQTAVVLDANAVTKPAK